MAVTAAIDLDGRVTSYQVTEKSIEVEKFVEFLRGLRAKVTTDEVYVFLDNLRVHHSNVVKDYCNRNKIVLVFNGAYASEYNASERAWALSKRIFTQMLMNTRDYS